MSTLAASQCDYQRDNEDILCRYICLAIVERTRRGQEVVALYILSWFE